MAPHSPAVRATGPASCQGVHDQPKRLAPCCPAGKTFLKNRSPNPFERNMTDEFELTMRPLGRLTELLVGHDDSGFGAAWHLEYIEVTDTLMGVVSAEGPLRNYVVP